MPVSYFRKKASRQIIPYNCFEMLSERCLIARHSSRFLQVRILHGNDVSNIVQSIPKKQMLQKSALCSHLESNGYGLT